MSRKIIAAVLTLAMLLGMFPMTALAAGSPAETVQITQTPVTAETQEEETTQPTEETVPAQTIEVTRAQWIQALVAAFGMTVEEDNYPDNYFSDLTGEEDYYRDILVAVEFGVIDIEAGLPFEPDAAATREFAAHTLNFCLGFQLEETVYSFSEAESATYPDDIQIAVNRGWFELSDGAFMPEQPITEAEKTAMLEDAAAVLASDVISEDYENSYVFSEEVIELPENTVAQLNSDTELILASPETAIAQGDIFAVYMDGLPVVYQADAVAVSGSLYTITVTNLSINDYLVSVDAQGSMDADLADFEVAEGLEAIYILDDGTETTDARASGSRKIDAIILSDEINGYKVHIEVNNMKLNWRSKGTSHDDIDVSGIVTGRLWCHVSIPFGAAVSDFTDVLSLGSVPIGPLGRVSVTANLSIDGSVSMDYGAKFSAGVTYSSVDGWRIPMTFEKTKFSLTVEATLDASICASVGLTNIPLLSAACRATVGLKVNCTMRYRGDDATPLLCIHTDAWLYATAGAYATVGISQWGDDLSESWSHEITIWDRNHSPVRSTTHFEDGTIVDSCTYGDTSFGGYNSYYYSSSGSKYANGGVSSVYNAPVYTYTTDDSGNATITGYSGAVSSLSIPSTIDGYPVTAIGDSAFSGNSSLYSVTLPSGVVSIGASAFKNCTALQYVTMPDTLTTIGDSAFYNCTGLVTIEIPDAVTSIGACAFKNCTNLTNVTMSNSLESMGYNAFGNCTKLTGITIPKTIVSCDDHYGRVEDGPFYNCASLKNVVFEDGLTAIPYFLFIGCNSIETIDIPDTVTSIGSRAFESCTNLTTVKMSSNLETLGSRVFKNCTALTGITIPKTIVSCDDHYGNVEDGPFYNCASLKNVVFEDGLTAIPYFLFIGCNGIESIAIPDSVTSIGNRAFESCTNLTSVKMTSNLETLGSRAFKNCTALTGITIPKTIVSCDDHYGDVEDGPFYNCTSLKNVVFEDGLTAIPYFLFIGCNGIESITIPDSVTSIGNRAFESCTNLTTVKMSSNLETLGSRAFKNCTALAAITIPKTLVSCDDHYGYVDEGPFYNCTNLKNVTIENGITTIPYFLFIGCNGFETIEIPSTVTTIENRSFQACTALTSITIPATVTSIGNRAFEGCTALPSVTIPNSVTSMGENVFYGCTSLTEVKLSDHLTKLGSGAFGNCSALPQITIPKSLTTCSGSIFSGCTSLKTVTLEEGMTAIPANLCYNATALEAFVFPESVTSIGSRAFQNTGLTEIAIPDAVTSTGDHILADCVNLKKVTWTAGTTTLPTYAFAGSGALEEVILPDTVTSMSKGVFRACDSLVTVTLSAALTNISEEAFYDCDVLETITIPDKVTKISGSAFYNCDALTDVVIPNSVTSIGAQAFYDCDALPTITIPFGTTSIGNSVFYDCDALASVRLGNSVASIGTYIFYHCDVLADVYLGRDLKTVSANAFQECPVLEEIVIPYFTTSIADNAFNSSINLKKVVTHENLASIGTTAFSYPDVTVFYGPGGSYTETWCTENGYTFVENTSAATSVTLSDTAVSIPKGSTYTLDMTIDPADFADAITFKSGNTAVATVDESGKITAVATGTATIKVIVGDASASCKVTVTQNVTKLALNKTTLALDVPDTYQLTATITPTDATNQVLEWTSSNETAATVDENGLVTAVGNGTAVITAAATDGSGISASCTVTVTDPNNIPVSGISLDQTSLTMQAMDTCQLTATVSPEDAANKKLSWTSSDESVATVDENGVVTAVAKGTATITAAATDESGVSAGCTVNVTNTAYMVSDVSGLESSHNYPNGCTDFWIYTATGADSLRVTFDARTEMEDGFDYLHIYDGEGNLVGTYTGTELAGQTVEIPGDTVKIQIESDDSGTEWGFKVTEVQVQKQVSEIASGWSGYTTWVLTDDGVITFSGEGAMKNYTYKSEMPWYAYADQITSVVIEEGVTSIGDYAFYGMGIESITIPETVTTIGSYAFKGAEQLDGVVLPAGLTKLGESAFYGCTSLSAIDIPASLWTVQPYTFKNCTALESVTFHEGNLQKISDGAFYGTALTSVTLPDCLSILDVYVFKNCTSLASVTLGSGITQIREASLYGTAISEIAIPEGVTVIKPYAFKNCVNLVSVDLPSTLTNVDEAAFYACTALASVELPDAVTEIGNYAFRKCTGLTSVEFGSGLTDIGESSFYGCTGLTDLVIPANVTAIQAYAFKGCTGVTSVSLPDALVTIGDSAFHTCTGLKTIVIPTNVETIGAYCFSGSWNLWQLTFQGDAPTIGTSAFKSLVATAYYPGDNATWTADIMQNYGGTITWEAK